MDRQLRRNLRRVVGSLGHQLYREPHAGQGDRTRHVDAAAVRRHDSQRARAGSRAPAPAADAVAADQEHDRCGPQGGVRVPADDPRGQEQGAGSGTRAAAPDEVMAALGWTAETTWRRTLMIRGLRETIALAAVALITVGVGIKLSAADAGQAAGAPAAKPAAKPAGGPSKVRIVD